MFVQSLKIENQLMRISGDGLYQAQVNRRSSFLLHSNSPYHQLEEVKILTHPLEYPCQIDILDQNNGTWIVQYIPKEIGQIQIEILLDDQPAYKIPCQINIFDLNQIYISKLTDGYVNQWMSFLIDISRAGIGQLEILVNDGHIACDILSRSASQYEVTFLPRQGGSYQIDIRFNGLIIPGSPYLCFIHDLTPVIVSNHITYAQVGCQYSFDIESPHRLFDVHIRAPSGRSVSFQRLLLNESQTRLDYILDEMGRHQVNVRSDTNMNVYGGSFSVQTYDIHRVIVSDIPHFLIFNQTVQFTVDVSKAGEGQLEVKINDGSVPNQMKALGNNIFQFTFLPIENELHQISITFNGEQLPDFPKECEVLPADNIQIHGPGLHQVLLNTPTWLNINTIHDGSSDLQVTIIAPNNEEFIPSTLLTSAGLRIDWTPAEVGTYRIEANSKNHPIPGSPFQVKCYNPKRVLLIPPIKDSTIHRPTKFIIDTSHAGEGHLEVRVNCAGLNIPNQINPTGHGQFEVQFTPQKSIIHQCNIFFNGELIPGSPLPINVMDIERILAIGKGLGSIPIHSATSFTILTQHSLNKDVKCSIKGPDDRLISCILTRTDPNRYEMIYTPDRVGEYHIDIFADDVPIDGSPFIARSFDVTKIRIDEFPPATLVGSPTHFLIDATDSGSGNLEIAISKDGRNIPNQVSNEGGARFRIKFLPNQPAIHHVQIKFNGIEVPGSPVLCHVYSTDFTFENYEYAPIHKQTSFLIKPRSESMFNRNIHIDILSPLGQKILRRMSSNAYIDFIPNEIGPHEIRFYHIEDKRILLAKFICQVYDISKIRISDLPLAIAHQRYQFTINTSNVGQGILTVKIKQNEKKILHEQTRISMNLYEISFIPDTADDCSVQIIFNGESSLRTLIVPVKIDDEHIRVSPIPPGIVGEPVIFTIDVVDINSLSISIAESHSNRTVPHTMTRMSTDETRYEISFIPLTTRQHTISIFSADKLYSTYHVDICNLKKVRVSAIDDGIVGVPSVFSVDTHGAGEGHLEVIISDGQRTLPAELKSVQTRRFDISFIPEITGEHSIAIAFNGIPIEGSPFKIQIEEPSLSVSEEDDHEFILGGQLEGTKVGEVAWLICETSLTETYEDLDLYVTDPDALIIKHTRIQDSAGRWRIEFEPIKPGIYQIQTDVDQSTIILASAEILPIDHERKIYGERIVHPNVLSFLSIHSSHDHLKVHLQASNNEEIPIEIDRDSSEWKVQFTLPEIDCYRLIISNGVTEEQTFDIRCVAEETDFLRNGGIEDIARIIIHHSKLSSDDVNVIVKDPFAHTIPAAFYRNLDNDLIIEYIPVRPDTHEVFIRAQNNLLEICPIRLLAFQAQNTFDPVLRVQVKEILEHTFTGVIDHDRKLEINITDPFDRLIPFERLENARGELTISVSPIRVGTHWMRISNDDDDSFALIPIFAFDDDYIPLSPVGTPSLDEKDAQTREISDVEPAPLLRDFTTISETSEILSTRTTSQSPEQQIPSVRDNSTNTMPASDGRLSPEIQILDMIDLVDPVVGMISTFTFKDPNHQLNAIIYDANGDEVPHRVEPHSDGRKSISYEVSIVGPVEIHIFRGRHAIDGSPLIIHAFDPSAVELINFPKRIFINTVSSFLLDVTHAGKGSLKITIKDPTNRSLSVNLEKHLNDQIGIQFKPIISGIHTISILFNRMPIPKSPMHIYVENIEERGRSIYSKHQLMSLSQPQERLNSISPAPSYSRTSVERETPPQKESAQSKSEEKHPEELLPFTEHEIQRFQILRQKFDYQQPIDVIFDSRRYPFKIYFSTPFPLINTDIHLLIELAHLAHVDIDLREMRIPLQIIQQSPERLLLRFRPTFAGDYTINFKDSHARPLLGCPHILPIYNPNGIHIESFDPLQPIHDCHFICNIDNIGQGKFFLMIYHQSKPIKISYRIQSLSNTHIRVSFRPWKIGTYRIYLAYRNFPIYGLPIDIGVYDPEGLSITAEHKEPVVVKTTVAYKVNKRQAGQGQVKAELITPETSISPCGCHVHELNEEESLIEYIPNEPGRYQLRILFNNQLVQGKTMDTDVYSFLPAPVLSTAEVDIQKILPKDTPSIGDEVCLQILTEKSSIDGQVTCEGVSIPYQIHKTDNKRLWHLKFRPFTTGIYKIHLFHLSSSIMHTPYLIQVRDIDGKNYLSSIVNTPCMIQIHTKFTSNSQIRAEVLLGSREIPSTVTILHDHLIRIHFTPDEPGICFVHIYNGNQSIEGSPFLIRIKRPEVVEITGKCLERLRINDLGIFRVHCQGQRGTIRAKIFYLSVDDRSELGQFVSFQLSESYEQLTQFPAQIFRTSMTILLTARLRLTQERIRNLTVEEDNGHAVISFQLFEIPTQSPSNEQILNVLRNLIDKQLLNLMDPNRCLLHVICGSLVIETKGEPISIKFFSLPNGDYLGEFTPKKIGQYRIDVLFNNESIDGSPFYSETYDPLQVYIENLPKDIIVGTENTFDIITNQAGNAPLEVMITSPSANNVPCKIDERSKIKRIRFTPNEIGLHHLDIKFGSDQVPNTPIKLIVKDIRLITAYGDGLHQSLQNKIASFFIDTKEIEGDLNVRIEDSSTLIENTLQRVDKSTFKVTYTPLEVGYVNITIKWNGKDILNSPFNAIVINPARVRLAVSDERSLVDSDNHMHVRINEEKKLRFDTSQAGPGILKATIQNIKKNSIPVRVDQQGSIHTLSFIATRAGHYDLMITYGDHPLPNMPIRLIVSSGMSDQSSTVYVSSDDSTSHGVSQVICSGDGLRIGIVGQERKCLIDTRHVGPGDLTVYCQGNHKSATCRLFDHGDGTFTLFIKPQESGKHLLTIKYDGENVPGSPFTVRVSGPPDARKVRVHGPGIESGVLSTFQSHFICETKGAGAGQLTVKIRGPKGAFRVEMKREHIQDRTITCRYYPTEPGDYLLSVKWSGEHVYGSPFHARIHETEEELQAYQYELQASRLLGQQRSDDRQ